VRPPPLQELSSLAKRLFRQTIGGYFDKPAGFVRSARRFWAPETSCFRVRFVKRATATARPGSGIGLNDNSRAFAQRFAARQKGKYPTQMQAGAYLAPALSEGSGRPAELGGAGGRAQDEGTADQ